MCLLGGIGGKRIFKSVYFPVLLPPERQLEETRQMEIVKNPWIYPSTANEKKKKGKKGKKKIEREGEVSTRPMNYARECTSGANWPAIIRSLRGLLRRNNHRLPVIITVERVEGWKGRIDVSFRLEIKKKHGRGWRMERSFSTTSNSSEEDVEIAVAFSTPLLLSLSLSLSTYVFLRKFTSRRGLSTYVRNGIINQSREFVMKNVKRSFITKLSIEERESDEIGLPSVSFVNRRWD